MGVQSGQDTGDTSGINCVITFAFPTITGQGRQLGQFMVISLSSVAGVPEKNIHIIDVTSRMDSRKTIISFHLYAESDIDGWTLVNRIRRSFADKSSPLNTVGNMKRVFNGALFEAYEPNSAKGPSPKSGKPRYRASALVDPLNCPRPPSAPGHSGPPRTGRVPEKPVRQDHILPVDPAHVPFDVIVIPSGTKSPPESPKREFHLHLPKLTGHSHTEEDEPIMNFIDLSKIDDMLRKPPPAVPSSLLQAMSQFKQS